jgi:hypothetical protein
MRSTLETKSRIVHNAEALAWLAANPAREGMCVMTSMPDISETPYRDLLEWKAWFMSAAETILRWLPPRGMAVFYQSDIRYQGHWIAKDYLVQRAAENVGAHLVWHKIACRKPPGTLGIGRPSYAHMLCYARSKLFSLHDPGPDVLPDTGEMSFSRATGTCASNVACTYLRASTSADTIVDPFCGEGSILAAANKHGFDAIGVELSEKRCAKARAMR